MSARLLSKPALRKDGLPWPFATWILALALCNVSPAYCRQGAPSESNQTTLIPAAEFSRIVKEFSESGGYFPSDNFTSNEDSYLHIVGKLQELGVSGGAYIGVGPEQNFTYIAKIRPRIAFIVDIRRQAAIQHLLYKAIFHWAENRTAFLSLLFSRPVPGTGVTTGNSLRELLDYIRDAPTTREAFRANLATVRKTIEEDFAFPLSSEDAQTLEYIYSAFWTANLRIGSRGTVRSSSGLGGIPTLADLILATDLNGNQENFLAQEADYQFVRSLEEQNRVIPVVGDFAGAKALSAVAGYLRKNGYTVSAFYVSNVEQFLYQDDVFGRFAENVTQLPISDRSVFIRAFLRGEADRVHPASVPGYRSVTLFQKISVFLQDYREGRYSNYRSLVTTHYIAGTAPGVEVSPSPVP